MWCCCGNFSDAYRGAAISVVGFWNSVAASVTMIFHCRHFGASARCWRSRRWYSLSGDSLKPKPLEELEHILVGGRHHQMDKFMADDLARKNGLSLWAGRRLGVAQAWAKVEVHQTDGGTAAAMSTHQPFFVEGTVDSAIRTGGRGGNPFAPGGRIMAGKPDNRFWIARRKTDCMLTLSWMYRERHALIIPTPMPWPDSSRRSKARCSNTGIIPPAHVDIGNELNLNSNNAKVWDAVDPFPK